MQQRVVSAPFLRKQTRQKHILISLRRIVSTIHIVFIDVIVLVTWIVTITSFEQRERKRKGVILFCHWISCPKNSIYNKSWWIICCSDLRHLFTENFQHENIYVIFYSTYIIALNNGEHSIIFTYAAMYHEMNKR